MTPATTGYSEKAPNTPPIQPQFSPPSVSPQPQPQPGYALPQPVSGPSFQHLLSVDDQKSRRRAARESRITLPDEAARYIQSQQDSPIPSPKPRPAELPRAQESPDIIDDSPEHASAAQQEHTRPTPSSRAPSRTPTDEDVPPEDRSAYYNPPFQPLSPPPAHRKPPPSRETIDYPPMSSTGIADSPRTDSQRITTVATSPAPPEEMEFDSVATARVPSRPSPVTSSSGNTTPGASTTTIPPRPNLPPYSDETPQPTLPLYQSTNAYGNYQQQQEYNQMPAMNQPYPHSQTNGYDTSMTTPIATNGGMYQSSTSQTTLVSSSSYPIVGSVPRGNPPSLLPIELPITRIRVLTSHIRANDRGKDVIAFCIQVQPGQREPWVIEKMYSDVLALDSRVRFLLNKTTLKRLAPLPDSKLFKDNAPAKVDQRKMLLEQYLQSVVTAPLKDVGDLCAFFCTDLSKGDRAPVSNQGYKEGYLTKRGKNFGGWKTRYFILQNGILEYFEGVSLLFIICKDTRKYVLIDRLYSEAALIWALSKSQVLKLDDSKNRRRWTTTMLTGTRSSSSRQRKAPLGRTFAMSCVPRATRIGMHGSMYSCVTSQAASTTRTLRALVLDRVTKGTADSRWAL